MKISKSKRELAQLLIEAGVTQFPEGASWAAQCSKGDCASFYGGERPKRNRGESVHYGDYCGSRHDVKLPTLIHNWHQTVLSREEFDQIVAEAVVTGELEQDVLKTPSKKTKEALDEAKDIEIVWTNPPTIEQLAAEYRNRRDYAECLQQEADDAKASAEAKLAELVAAGEALGLVIGVARPEPELVITDWRDLREGDVVFVESMSCEENEYSIAMVGRECVVVSDGDSYPICLMNEFTPKGESYWIGGAGDEISWRFIRRP